MSENLLRPRIELVPEKMAVKRGESTELLVLVRIVPPVVKSEKKRPALNLGLVLDRSGSMAGAKLEAVKRAADFALRQLEETDRLSVTIYDDEVETIVPSVAAKNKASIARKIAQLQCGGCTALHDGWVAGATQVANYLEDKRLNRVLLLTDGLANAGETNLDRICSHVKGLAERGVSTTAMGVGDDFNEDLLEQMAKSGDGNYYFIERAADLERIFAAELSGLMATVGRKVSLGLEMQAETTLLDVLSDLEKTKFDRLMLSNLVSGNPLEVVVKLRVAPLQRAADVCLFRLAYDAPETKDRQVMREALSLKIVSADEWENLPSHSQVTDAAARLQLARQREEISRHLDSGDLASASATLTRARGVVDFMAAPAAIAAETEDFDLLEAEISTGNRAKAAKLSKYSSYSRRYSKGE